MRTGRSRGHRSAVIRRCESTAASTAASGSAKATRKESPLLPNTYPSWAHHTGSSSSLCRPINPAYASPRARASLVEPSMSVSTNVTTPDGPAPSTPTRRGSRGASPPATGFSPYGDYWRGGALTPPYGRLTTIPWGRGISEAGRREEAVTLLPRSGCGLHRHRGDGPQCRCRHRAARARRLPPPHGAEPTYGRVGLTDPDGDRGQPPRRRGTDEPRDRRGCTSPAAPSRRTSPTCSGRSVSPAAPNSPPSSPGE